METAQRIFDYFKQELLLSVPVCNAMISVYAATGQTSVADREIIGSLMSTDADSALRVDEVGYNSLIAGYSRERKMDMVFDVSCCRHLLFFCFRLFR